MNEEHIYHVFLDMLEGNIRSKRGWERQPDPIFGLLLRDDFPEEERIKIVKDFDCQIQTLLIFGSKAFFVTKEELLKRAEDELQEIITKQLLQKNE